MKKVWMVAGVAGAVILAVILIVSRTRRQSLRHTDGPASATQDAAQGNEKGQEVLSSDSAQQRQTRQRQPEVDKTPEVSAATGLPDVQQAPQVDFSTETRALNDALDEDDIELALKEARRLMKHPDADVRSEVAFALSWIGVKGLPELTFMLTDPDPEVADDAFDHWKSGLDAIESESDKGALIGSAAELFGENMSDDVMFDLVMELGMLDDEEALPQLGKMLLIVTKPEHKEEIKEAIHMTMTEVEEPSQDEAELLQQIPRELEARVAIKAEEAAADLPQPSSGAAGSGNADSAASVQGLPGRK